MAKKKLGRPPKTFTPAQIDKISKSAFAGARNNTIAVAMGIDGETFNSHFKELCTQKRAEGMIALLLTQSRMAQTMPVMAIWLGKQLLDQADKSQVSGDLSIGVINYATTCKAANKDKAKEAQG